MKNFIHLSAVNLHYSSLAFRERSLKAMLLKSIRVKKQTAERVDIHALKNISLDIHSGERVGLLGHNGAGKSTLLKTIAGLYPISSGICKVEGRVRSLLELGLGFELEATGRENIMYRGLLFNQSAKKMRQMEADIINFADIGHFIDYPIKTYSAGMLVRLAFAISTAIPGEILLLDEVIGAGDAAFMEKAKLRITSLITQAEIMILASHNLADIKTLCNRVLVLDHGAVVFDGEPSEAVAKYQQIVKAKLGQQPSNTTTI